MVRKSASTKRVSSALRKCASMLGRRGARLSARRSLSKRRLSVKRKSHSKRRLSVKRKSHSKRRHSVKRKSSSKPRHSVKSKSSSKRQSRKVPDGYRGSVKVGDMLKFYCPQGVKVSAPVAGIRKTKNNRYLAFAFPKKCSYSKGTKRTSHKVYQFVSGSQ